MAIHISKYPVIEQLYAKIGSEVSKALRDSLFKFLVLILSFQMRTMKYFDPDRRGRRTGWRMNLITADSIKRELRTVEQAKGRVDKDIVFVDAAVTKHGIDKLRERQQNN